MSADTEAVPADSQTAGVHVVDGIAVRADGSF